MQDTSLSLPEDCHKAGHLSLSLHLMTVTMQYTSLCLYLPEDCHNAVYLSLSLYT